MSDERIVGAREFDNRFLFRSYGVTIAVESTQPEMLRKARELVYRAFGGRVEFFEGNASEAVYSYGLDEENGLFRRYENGQEKSAGPSERNFFKVLNSALRIKVAEHAEGCIFVHAGAVGWKGRALIIPGKSHSGKSTLTAELLRNGAVYYSDEYAVLAADGKLLPFPRYLSIRDSSGRETEMPPAALGASQGEEPIPVGMVLLTRFEEGTNITPEVISPGEGIMEIIPNTVTMRKDPAFSLKVLDLVARRAIIARGPRGDVKSFAKFLLEFFDINTKLPKVT
jgi:hypothetical protein